MAYWVDDGFDTWPEVARAGTAAAGLYLRCGVWIARNLANGRIADAVVPVEIADGYGTVEWRRRLVDVGLWAAEGSGYRDLCYFDLNPTAAQIEATRRQKAAAGRKGGLARGKKQPLSKRQARASGVLEPPSLPPPSSKGEGGAALPPDLTLVRSVLDAASKKHRAKANGRDALAELRALTDPPTEESLHG
jgi:hypothetical protein